MAQRRRRRIRPGDAEQPDRPAVPAPGGARPADPVPAGRPAEPPPVRRPRERPTEERESERGLRGLVGGGSSQVGVSAAMRARDAARPRPEDVAAAEEHLPIVLRGWVPRDPPQPP